MSWEKMLQEVRQDKIATEMQAGHGEPELGSGSGSGKERRGEIKETQEI